MELYFRAVFNQSSILNPQYSILNLYCASIFEAPWFSSNKEAVFLPQQIIQFKSSRMTLSINVLIKHSLFHRRSAKLNTISRLFFLLWMLFLHCWLNTFKPNGHPDESFMQFSMAECKQKDIGQSTVRSGTTFIYMVLPVIRPA